MLPSHAATNPLRRLLGARPAAGPRAHRRRHRRSPEGPPHGDGRQAAARVHALGLDHVRVERGLAGATAGLVRLVPVAAAADGACRIQLDQTFNGQPLVALGIPVGSDIILVPDGDVLIGRIPDELAEAG